MTRPAFERAGTVPRTTVPSVDVVVVNWNAGDYLMRCLRSLQRSERQGFRFDRVVVVDNASTDDSLRHVRESALPLTVIENDVNLGFGAACNLGAKKTTADYVVFVNPDAAVAPDAISRVAALMEDERSGSIGICGGQMLSDGGAPLSSCSRLPTVANTFAKMLGLSWWTQGRWGAQRIEPDKAYEGRVDQVIGAFFIIRAALFKALGGFDERFFLYFEDVDLAARSRAIGWDSYYLPEARIVHTGEVSSNQVRTARLTHWMVSRSEYAHKHWSAAAARLVDVGSLTLEPAARTTAALVAGRLRDIPRIWRATAGFARHIAQRSQVDLP